MNQELFILDFTSEGVFILKEKTGSWIDYWNTENIFKDANLQKSMEVFIRSTSQLLNYNIQDIILDIGCGPGFLEAFLKDRVKEIHGLDTSEMYMDICRKKFSQEKNVFFYKLNNKNYTDLSLLKTNKFSKIICLSVIQYYKSITDVEMLIENVRKVALPGAKFLIADILTTTRILSDIYGILKAGIKEKYLLETLKFLFRARISAYHKTRNTEGLLSFSDEDLKALINKMNLNAVILREKLTISENRIHLLINF